MAFNVSWSVKTGGVSRENFLACVKIHLVSLLLLCLTMRVY